MKAPVTQTKNSPMTARLSDFFVFLLSRKIAFGARIVQDFFVFFPPVVEAGAKKRAFCLQKKETEKMACIQKRDNGNYIVRVSMGYDPKGKQIIKSKTFHPSSKRLLAIKIPPMILSSIVS